MKSSSSSGGSITPLMRQYNKIKAQYPDKILFFRMGDFYEMFGDDAVKAAPILNIALTSRGHINGEKIPLAGVPHHSADKYLARLLEAGEKVVIVEQTEDPRQAKGVVKREVVEILTPGTATIEGVVDETDHLYLLSLYPNGSDAGLAYVDLLSGRFLLEEGRYENIFEKIRVLSPQEVIYPQVGEEDDLIAKLRKDSSVRLTGYEEWNFEYKTAVRELCEFFDVSTLDGFGVADKKLGLTAAGAIYRYLRENNRTRLDHIRRLTEAQSDDYMTLDYNTIRNLELVRNLSENSERDSLFHAVNRTSTAGGARRLKENILRPYKKLGPILHRQQGVKELYHARDLALDLSLMLKRLPDLERLAGRLGMRKINPRQLASIKDGLSIGTEILARMKELRTEVFSNIVSTYPASDDLIRLIVEALVDEPPLTANKGSILRRGFSEELDGLKDSIRDARDYIASLQKTERERTGITSLKVGFNKVFGYYIEVTRTHQDKVPSDYIRKQTLVNAERFITQKLKEKEELILAAEEKIFSLEERLYNELTDRVAEWMGNILMAADYLSEIDLVASLSNLAAEKMYCCPELKEDGALEIIEGRHPVIEDLLPPGSFIANDVNLAVDDDRIMVLTGPNMSGKSTYLRQNGLIVILAQIGSFVPAESAVIGLVDRVFTRVGAIDNLARGQSTFLVEMIESSNILHNATERSLILLDEVGRGTSTFDGLSIAWSVVEYINENIRARTIFATHYHELTGMADIYERIFNCQVAVKRWEDQIIFLHKIIPGGCDDSYGIEVARLAGIPRKAITRSKELLKLLESGKFSQSQLAKGIHKTINQRSLFDITPSPVEEELKKIDLNNTTPIDALRILNKLKEILGDE
ncbi:MAG: DNA mismatch repair protein MutS [candidate division Zixibacteria bacterium HGW-Zixibacteria-1]|nr:MAG: DNA mismatch repair protein MutS [candidate division Zixibacteria bacterium HGW-Zixibacteria-1]